MRNNSTIYKNPQDQHIFDLSQIGTLICASGPIEINQQNHYFQVGDILYYNVKTQLFDKAVAVNNLASEVCGGVLKVIDNNNFIMITEGEIPTSRYIFDVGTTLYLSDVYPGRLVSFEPQYIIKQIATKTADGIMLDIQRGYRTFNQVSSEELEPYTQDELDEIIKNIW